MSTFKLLYSPYSGIDQPKSRIALRKMALRCSRAVLDTVVVMDCQAECLRAKHWDDGRCPEVRNIIPPPLPLAHLIAAATTLILLCAHPPICLTLLPCTPRLASISASPRS